MKKWIHTPILASRFKNAYHAFDREDLGSGPYLHSPEDIYEYLKDYAASDPYHHLPSEFNQYLMHGLEDPNWIDKFYDLADAVEPGQYAANIIINPYSSARTLEKAENRIEEKENAYLLEKLLKREDIPRNLRDRANKKLQELKDREEKRKSIKKDSGWPKSSTWDKLEMIEDDYDFYEAFNEIQDTYLMDTITDVEDALDVFTESSGYGYSGEIVFQDNSGQGKWDTFSIPTSDLDIDVFNIAQDCRSRKEFRKKYKDYLSDLIKKNG